MQKYVGGGGEGGKVRKPGQAVPPSICSCSSMHMSVMFPRRHGAVPPASLTLIWHSSAFAPQINYNTSKFKHHCATMTFDSQDIT